MEQIIKALKDEDANVLGTLLDASQSATLEDYQKLLQTSLSTASGLGKLQAVKVLLERGACIDALPGKSNPLLRAVVGEHHKVVETLLEHGAKVDDEVSDGMTPLVYAATKGYSQVVEVLLTRYGANVNACDNQGKTVLHYLATKENVRMNEKVLKSILKQEIEVDAKDKTGRTALHWACANGRVVLVQHLLMPSPPWNCAKINLPESHGRTPLHLAANHGKQAVVEILLSKGADANARAQGGWTPLHVVCIVARTLE